MLVTRGDCRKGAMALSKTAIKNLQAGVPLILLLAGGSVFLSQFVQGRVEAKDRKIKSSSEREFNLEEEHRKMMAKLDVENNYKVVRIHRPEK